MYFSTINALFSGFLFGLKQSCLFYFKKNKKAFYCHYLQQKLLLKEAHNEMAQQVDEPYKQPHHQT